MLSPLSFCIIFILSSLENSKKMSQSRSNPETRPL